MTDEEKNKEVVDAFTQGDVDDGFEMFELHYAEEVLRCIRMEGWGLRPEDWRDVYQNVMLEVFQKIEDEPDFDFQNLVALVKHIAVLRTKDARRAKKRKVKWSSGEFDDQYIEDMLGSALARHLGISQPEWNEIDAAIHDAISKLEGMQHAAAVCFIDVFLEYRKVKPAALAEAMSDYLGQPVNRSQATSAWRHAKNKIREALKKRKFDPWGE